MATKTLILRPESVVTDSLDEEAMSKIAFYPSSFDFSNAHKLVNEEIADNDSSYISISPNGKIVFKLKGIKPSDFKGVEVEPSNLKAYVTIKSETSNTSASCTAIILSSYWSGSTLSMSASSDNTYSIKNSAFALLTDPSGNNSITQEYFFSYFNNNSIWDIDLSLSAGTNDKAKPIRVTQVWLELIYESVDLETIYFKNNNNWVSTSGRIWKKKNGIWSLSDSSFLNNGVRYIINNQIEQEELNNVKL